MTAVPFIRLAPTDPELEKQLLEASRRVIGSGRYLGGRETAELESMFASETGVPYAFATGSGSEALFLSLRALGIGPGDEVLTPAFNAPAGVAAIRLAGATPVPVDVSEEDFTIDIESAKERITPRTRGMVPVHLFGFPCRMTELLDLAGSAGIEVVEDCAQALGAEIDGRPVGSLGDAGVFSFYPTKNVGAMGDAGMVVTRSDRLHRKLVGMRPGPETIGEGVGARIDEIQAAFLRVYKQFPERVRPTSRLPLSCING